MGGFVTLVERRARGGATYRSWSSLRSSIRRFERERDKPIIAGTRRALRKAWREGARDFVARGVGRRLWGRDVTSRGAIRRGSNLRTFFRERRIRRQGERFLTGFTLQGFARLVERGGRTRPHDIPKNRREGTLLAFTVPGGGSVVVPRVRHPGAPVRRLPFAEPSLRRNEAFFARFIQEGLLKQWDQAVERNA